jgi:hypothetical protein
MTAEVNPSTNAFFLASQENKVVPNFKRFFRGLNMLGKHFTVRTLEGDRPTRHYTICNVMNPPIYKELVRLLKAKHE